MKTSTNSWMSFRTRPPLRWASTDSRDALQRSSHLKAAAQHGEPSGENDIAVTFYKSRTPDGSSARQAMFKLQALARIYRKTHRGDEEIFDDLKARFKGLEDALGRVDYFEELSRQVQNFGLDPKVETYLRQRYSEEIDALSTLLLEEGWLQWQGAAVGSPAVADTLNQLDTVEWRKASKDRNKILKSFQTTSQIRGRAYARLR